MSPSQFPSSPTSLDMSDDGRFVAFSSETGRVFVHDRQTGINELMPLPVINPLSVGDVSISGDGRVVAYEVGSNPEPFVFEQSLWAYDRQAASVEEIGVFSIEPDVSDDGRFVAFVSAHPLDPEADFHDSAVYVHDRLEARTTLVSRNAGGKPAIGGAPAISESDGRYVAFHSNAANLVPNDTNGEWDIFVQRESDSTHPPSR